MPLETNAVLLQTNVRQRQLDASRLSLSRKDEFLWRMRKDCFANESSGSRQIPPQLRESGYRTPRGSSAAQCAVRDRFTAEDLAGTLVDRLLSPGTRAGVIGSL